MKRAKGASILAVMSVAATPLAGDTSKFTSNSTLALTIGPRTSSELNRSVAPPKPAFRKLALSGHVMSWKPQRTSGAPLQVTYAVVTRDLETKGAINCASMKPAAHALSRSAISDASFRRELTAAFALWSAAAAIDFVETTNERDANILIGAEASPRGHAFTNVTPSQQDASAISKALICLSPGSRWKLSFDGNLEVYDLRYTLAHEIGHAIGLDHPSRAGHLMSYRYTETQSGLSEGDRAGVISLYGPRLP